MIKSYVVGIFLFFGGILVGWKGHSFVDSIEQTVFPVATQGSSLIPTPTQTNEHQQNALSNNDNQAPRFFSSDSLLNNTQLGMVIELIKQDLDEQHQSQLNQNVVRYANSLLVSGTNAESTEQRLLALLGNFDTKEDVLDVLAKFYSKERKYQKAISALYNLRSMKNFDNEYQSITHRIDVLINKTVSEKESLGFESELKDFYEFLLSKEPDNFDIQYRYAEFEYENRNYLHAEQLLAVLLHHPSYASQSEVLMKKVQRQNELIENGVIPVPLEKAGEHYLVSVLINNQEPVKLIIDTGATLSILSPKVIQNLGMNLEDVEQHMSFSTANGVVKAPVLELESMAIRNHMVRHVKVGVLSSLSHTKVGGLLGMNFLNQFVFFLDQKNNTLELTELE